MERFIYKASGRVRSDTFKRQPAFSFTVIKFWLKKLSTTIKTFYYYGTIEYKAVLKLYKQFACIATHSLVMSPYSRDFL